MPTGSERNDDEKADSELVVLSVFEPPKFAVAYSKRYDRTIDEMERDFGLTC